MKTIVENPGDKGETVWQVSRPIKQVPCDCKPSCGFTHWEFSGPAVKTEVSDAT